MKASAADGGSALQLSMSRIREETDSLFASLLVSSSARTTRLYDAMRYAALGGGKRLRPLLVTAVADLFDVPRGRALRAGLAVECIHTHSLIHDDLPCMDDDDLRRGRPTVHRAFDEATALLAGDALHALAFQLLADPATHPDPKLRMELVGTLAAAAGVRGMAGGQMLDLLQSGGDVIDLKGVRRLQDLKTGALFAWCAEAAARLGRAPAYALIRVIAYARCLGLAFQITDDLIDRNGSEAIAGKRVGKDAARGKVTLVQLLGPDAARREAVHLLSSAAQHVESFGPRAQILIELADFVARRQF